LRGFEKFDVVIGDRNNHTFKHRKAVYQAIKKPKPETRIVLISMKVVKENSETLRLAQDRIKARKGHPTLTADNPALPALLGMFSREHQPPNFRGDSRTPQQWSAPRKGEEDADFLVDHLIEVNPALPPTESLAHILAQLHTFFPLRFPTVSAEEISGVVERLIATEKAGEGPGSPSGPTTPSSSPAKSPGTRREKKATYYGIQFGESEVQQFKDLISSSPQLKPLNSFGNQLPLEKHGGPHVTLLFVGSGSESSLPGYLVFRLPLF